MKRILIALLLCSVMFGCSKDDNLEPDSRVLILQVDYTTLDFEGAKELILDTTTTSSDSIPVIIDYTFEDGSGNVSLYYKTEDHQLFDGSIESGENTGERVFPTEFISIDNLDTLSSVIAKPADTEFQYLNANLTNPITDYQPLWDAISKLELVSEYLEGDKKVGVFIYTPKLTEENSDSWKYYVILNK